MVGIFNSFGTFFSSLGILVIDPLAMLLLFGSVLMGIIFGATPGLTATLGVALLTTLTYGMDLETAMVALMGIYVGGVYGGSYTAILVNIPGTAASAATALDGYPLAQKGEAGKALGLTTTSSAIGTIIGMIFVVIFTPIISALALEFTSFEKFLLALFGIIISGTLTSPDLVIKGWIAGFLGLWMASIGRDALQNYPRFDFGIPELQGRLDIVPVLIGAFGIPQIMQTLRDDLKYGEMAEVKRIIPEFKTIKKNFVNIVRSALIGVGIGAVPGIGEDIAGWVSYGTAKRTSPRGDEFGTGVEEAVIATETANNACIGGAMIPLLSLGIPGSPPAAMLLGALMLHGVSPGPMLRIDRPGFVFQVSAILLLASVVMWIIGILLSKQVIKILKIPITLFMPVIGVLCVIGSYALGLNIFNLYLMFPVGIMSYFLIKYKYPIAPLVIGVILGNMFDENLRRALMVSKGSFAPIFTPDRWVAFILFVVIIYMILGQIGPVKRFQNTVAGKVKEMLRRNKKNQKSDLV